MFVTVWVVLWWNIWLRQKSRVQPLQRRAVGGGEVEHPVTLEREAVGQAEVAAEPFEKNIKNKLINSKNIKNI